MIYKGWDEHQNDTLTPKQQGIHENDTQTALINNTNYEDKFIHSCKVLANSFWKCWRIKYNSSSVHDNDDGVKWQKKVNV